MLLNCSMNSEGPTTAVLTKPMQVQHLAQDFLLRLKKEEEVQEHLDLLAALDRNELAKTLATDDKRKAFWINLYNGFNLYFMRAKPGVNAHSKSRMKHFLRRQIRVAGMRLSLMDIENGILRRSKVWWGLGYIPRFRVTSFEKAMRVNELDARLHFALNCGAVSCPPIRFYSPESIDMELELATKSYLLNEVRGGKGDESSTLFVSSLFRAYRGDFKSRGGIMPFIRAYKELPEQKWKIKFITWDSATDLGDFASL